MGTALSPQENVIRGHRLHPEAAKRSGFKPLYPTPQTPAARAQELINSLVKSDPQILPALAKALAARFKLPQTGAAPQPATEADDRTSNRASGRLAPQLPPRGA